MNDYSLEQYESACEKLEEALRLNPQLKDARFYLGVAYLFRNQLDKAIVNLNRAVENNPNSEKVHWYLGILDLEVNVARAVEEFRTTCERFPMHALSWFLLGQALERTADYERAREAYEHVMSLTDSQSDLYKRARRRVGALNAGK